MNSNWKINRVGLIDFWYYDDEEFVFDDGRMLLRGANGSGKSVTMQSLIPLLLDGNIRPERLDAFGTRARKMEKDFEKEQTALEKSTEQTKDTLRDFEEDSVRADKFIALVKQYTAFSELTTLMINEFVDKIVVHEGKREKT